MYTLKLRAAFIAAISLLMTFVFIPSSSAAIKWDSSDSIVVPENQATVTSLAVTETVGTPVYSIVNSTEDPDSTDWETFTVDSVSGVLSFKSAQNYEASGIATKVYRVVARVGDGTDTISRLMYVSVSNVDEPYTLSCTPNTGGSPSHFFTEGGDTTTAITTCTASDPDSPTAGANTIYTLTTPGADAASFDLQTSTVYWAITPDHEAQTNHAVTVLATSASGDTATVPLNVKVNDETLTASLTGTSWLESNTSTTTAVATATANFGTPAITSGLTWSITGGTDSGSFLIDPTSGALYWASLPDAETPTDADFDSIYNVEVQAVWNGDVGAETSVAVSATFTVTSINEFDPVFDSGTTQTKSFGETSTTLVVDTFTVTDADTGTYTFSWSLSGTDSGSFTLDTTTGVLSFKGVPDFENPNSAAKTNSYSITITVSDNHASPTARSTSTAVTINVTDGTDPGGSVSVRYYTVAETTSPLQFKITGTDPTPNDTLTFTVVGGTDFEAFEAAGVQIDTRSANIQFKSGYGDYDNPLDASGNNIYQLLVNVNDNTGPGGTNETITITVEVTPVSDETPSTPTATSTSVAENTASGTVLVWDTTTITDADTPTENLEFRITGGDAGSRYTINLNTGEITMRYVPNYEADNVDSFTLHVRGGSQTRTVTFFVDITNVNETPTDLGGPGDVLFIDEYYTSSNGALFVPSLVDPDTFTSGPNVYSIVNSGSGQDGAKFTIDTTTGALSIAAGVKFDFENPESADGSNSYQVRVRVENQDSLDTTTVTTFEETITFSVDDMPDGISGLNCAGTPGGLRCTWNAWSTPTGDYTYTNPLNGVTGPLYNVRVTGFGGLTYGTGLTSDTSAVIGGLHGDATYTVSVSLVGGLISGIEAPTTEGVNVASLLATTTTLVTVGSVTNPAYGNPAAVNTSTNGAGTTVLNFAIPQGQPASINLGTVVSTTGTATITSTLATPTNTTTFNFVLKTGDKGETGAQGLKGETGTQGLKGETGTGGTMVEVGTTTTLAAGSNATVTSTTVGNTTTLNFGIPAGANGSNGAPGATGPQGPAGATGPAGAKGETGAAGAAGATGPAGATGATGATGPQGPAGATGPAGAKGDKGDTGAAAPVKPARLVVTADEVKINLAKRYGKENFTLQVKAQGGNWTTLATGKLSAMGNKTISLNAPLASETIVRVRVDGETVARIITE